MYKLSQRPFLRDLSNQQNELGSEVQEGEHERAASHKELRSGNNNERNANLSNILKQFPPLRLARNRLSPALASCFSLCTEAFFLSSVH